MGTGLDALTYEAMEAVVARALVAGRRITLWEGG
jgi:hypothetical protein